MARNKTTITVAITGDARGLKGAFKEAEQGATLVANKMNDAGNKLTLGLTLPLVAAGAAAVNAASDLAEAMGKTEVIFGSASGAVTKWSETSAEAMGLASAAALDAAGNLGNMLLSAGVAEGDAADLSMSLVQLAADMGSLNNVDPSQMLIKLQAAMAGEAEPLRRFGVDINAAAVELKALEMGLVGVGEELSQQDKLLARYAIIMEQTTTAQGDFARTSENVANQTRILKAEVVNLSAEMGSNLLPVAKDLLGSLVGLTRAFGDLNPGVQKTIIQVAVLAAAAGPLAKMAALAIKGGQAFLALGAGLQAIAAPQAIGAITAASSAVAALGAAVSGAAVAFVDFSSAAYVDRLDEAEASTADLARAVDGVTGLFGQAALAGLEWGTRMREGREDSDDLTGAVDEGATAAARWADTANQKAAPAADRLREAFYETETAVLRATDAVVISGQRMRDALNPVTQLRDAQDKYNDALARLQEVSRDAEASAGDVEDAYWDLAEATVDLQSAQDDVDMSNAVDGVESLLRMLGLTNAEIDQMLAGFRSMDGATFGVGGSSTSSGGRQWSVDATGWGLPMHGDGGVVAGPLGSPQLIIAHAGETILPTHKQNMRLGGDVVVNIHNARTTDLNSDVQRAMTAVRLLGVV